MITLLIVFTTSIVMVWALAISCQVTMVTEIHCSVSHNCACPIYSITGGSYFTWIQLALASNNWMFTRGIVVLYEYEYMCLGIFLMKIYYMPWVYRHKKCVNLLNDNVHLGFPFDQWSFSKMLCLIYMEKIPGSNRSSNPSLPRSLSQILTKLEH